MKKHKITQYITEANGGICNFYSTAFYNSPLALYDVPHKNSPPVQDLPPFPTQQWRITTATKLHEIERPASTVSSGLVYKHLVYLSISERFIINSMHVNLHSSVIKKISRTQEPVLILAVKVTAKG